MHNIYNIYIYYYILISRSVLYPAQVIAHPPQKKNMKTISADVSWTVGGPPSYNSGSIFLRSYLYQLILLLFSIYNIIIII